MLLYLTNFSLCRWQKNERLIRNAMYFKRIGLIHIFYTCSSNSSKQVYTCSSSSSKQVYTCSSSSSKQVFFRFCLRIWPDLLLIILEVVLTPNLHLECLLASLAFSPNFLLCFTTAFSQVFFCLPHFIVHFTLKSNALLKKLFLSFVKTCHTNGHY